MYKYLLLLVICLIYSEILRSQNNNCSIKELEFNLYEKRFTNMHIMDELKIGDFYRIRVTQFDPEKYTLSVNGAAAPSPEGVTTALTSSLSLGDLTALASALGGNSVAALQAIERVASGETLIQKINEFSNRGADVKDVLSQLGNGETEDLHDDLKKAIKNIEDKIKSNSIEIVELNHEIWKTLFDAAVRKYENDLKDADLPKFDFNTFKSNFESHRSKIVSLINQVNDDFTVIENLDVKALVIPKALKDETNARLTKIDEAKTALLSTLTGLEGSVSVDNFTKIVDTIVAVEEQNTSREYLSPTIEFDAPQQTITIELTPRERKESFTGFTQSYVLPQKTSFSGLSYNVFLNDLNNVALSTQPVIDPIEMDTSFQFVREKNGEIQLGVSAMYHYGNRIWGSDTYFWHIGAGIGATFSESIQPRLLLGGGLAIGKTNKLMITGGGIFGPVNNLSTVYNIEETVPVRPTNFTVSRLEPGLFFSIGYTL